MIYSALKQFGRNSQRAKYMAREGLNFWSQWVLRLLLSLIMSDRSIIVIKIYYKIIVTVAKLR